MHCSESSRPHTLCVPPTSPRPEPGLAKGQMHYSLGPPGPGPAAVCSCHHLVMFWDQGNGDRGGLTLIFTASCPLHGSVHLGYSEPHVQPCHPETALVWSGCSGPQPLPRPPVAVLPPDGSVPEPQAMGTGGRRSHPGTIELWEYRMLHSVSTFCPSEASSNPQVCQPKCLQTLAIASSG